MREKQVVREDASQGASRCRTHAVVLWNTVYLERAAHALRGNGHAVDDALLQYLSPLGWEHINLTGDYLWRSSAKIGAGKFRPLRPLQPA
uniref:Tn3 family transposase n=1 Tax=Proteus mirabilis TaxID=584 RepID=UPI0035255471